MSRIWEANPAEEFKRRLGKSAAQLDESKFQDGCPEIWELTNGDVVVIGRDLTADYRGRLPQRVHVRADERLVVIPRSMLIAAKPDIPDA